MSDELVQRLEKLESHLSHVERLVEQMNEVLVEQGRVVTRLQARLRQVNDTLEAQELERIRTTSAKPPHYSA